jgi:predicted phage terminase large subunit-like protein
MPMQPDQPAPQQPAPPFAPAVSPFAKLIDYNLPFPNIKSMPLWMVNPSSPLSPEVVETVTALHTLGRAASHLADYAAFALDVAPAAHHRLICEAIDDLLADEFDELIINSPPGSAKSTYTSHALGAFFLGANPRGNVIVATHTADLSERWSRKVRNTLASAEHQKVFPDSSLSADSTAVSRWATSLGGEMLAAGVGGSILGFRADLGIIDDPISGFEQAQSETQLAKVHGWYENDFMTRLKPEAKVVLICQRLSPNDLAGYLIARNLENPTRRQRILILKMECDDPDNDPLQRQLGDRLWPEWYTPEMVIDAKRDDFKWRTLYQQMPPSDSGSWVSTEDIRHRPTPPSAWEPDTPRYGCSDLALSVNRGDYTVHFVVAVDTNGDWDIIDASRKRVDAEQTSIDIVTFCTTYRPREWLIDDDNMAKVMIPLVSTKARQLGTPVPWKMMPMRGQDKETRAAPLRGQFKRRKIFYPADAPFANWLTKELLVFPNAMGDGVDDGVDALSVLGRRLGAISPAPTVVAPTVKKGYSLDDLWETAPKQSKRIG